MTDLRQDRNMILICSYLGTFVVAFVVGCAVPDNGRITAVMAYSRIAANAWVAVMACLLYRDAFYSGFQKSSAHFVWQVLLSSVVVLTVNVLASSLRSAWISQATENQEILNGYTAVFPLGMFFDVVFFAPIIEETIIREIIQKRTEEKLRGRRAWISILLCSCIFAWIHSGASADILPYFAIGSVLGIVYKKTRNLALVTCAHSANNLVVFIASRLISLA